MEDQITSGNLKLDEYTKSSIAGAAKAAGIAAILSIVGTIFGAIAFFVTPKPETKTKEGFGSGAQFMADGSSILTIIVSLLINGILFYHLYRFSTVSKTAISNEHGFLLGSGLNSLASYFRIFALLFIISMGFMLMGAFALALGGAMK